MKNFTEILDKKGLLTRVKAPIDPVLQAAEIADRCVKNNGKAILFENNGTAFPLLMNAFASEERMKLALGVEHFDELGERMQHIFQTITQIKDKNIFGKIATLPSLAALAKFFPKVSTRKAPCQEVVMENPKLSALPILQCWPHDAGRFITLPCVHTKSPLSGIRNTGMYRMQVMSDTTTGMHWHMHKGGAAHFDEYKKIGRRMPVAVTLGGDPVHTYVATAPLPDGVEEHILSGFIRKKPVTLVKCLTQDIEVPADADFVIEGYIEPNEVFVTEGPFGDHTGFYSLPDKYPVFHVTCITHRKDAVYPATIVGIPPQEDAYIGLATERVFLTPIRMAMVPEMIDMYMPPEGVFHNIILVSINKSFPGQAFKVMNALWGAGQMMFNKFMIVVDEGVNIRSFHAVAEAVAKHFSTSRRIISTGPLDVLDHAAQHFAYGGKLGIDATTALPEEEEAEILFNIPSADEIKDSFPEIVSVDLSYAQQGFPFLVLGVNKKRSMRLLDEELRSSQLAAGMKIVIYIDDNEGIPDPADLAWIAANHADPTRDVFFPDAKSKFLSMDSTVKTEKHDGFKRPWPNPVVSSLGTISEVDKMWDSLDIEEMLPSPSLKYMKYCLSDRAEL
ncbi:MAG: menaquinone biosynthesis decarboxylase [Bacteroidota bacterium]